MLKPIRTILLSLVLVAFAAGGAMADDKKPSSPPQPTKEHAGPVKDGKACDPKSCDPKKCDPKNCDPKHCDPKACDHKGAEAKGACDPAKCPHHADGKAPGGGCKAPGKGAEDAKASPQDLGNGNKTK